MPARPDDAPESPDAAPPAAPAPEAGPDASPAVEAESGSEAEERIPLSLRATRSALRRVGALPPRALRLIAGRRVVIDGQTLAPEAQVAIRFLDAAPGDRIEDLPVAQARAELDAEGWLFGATTHIASVRDIEIPGAEGPLPARLYDPAPGTPHTGVLVFFHGGGYVLGGLETSDPLCRFLARCSGLAILSVGYRLAPEHPFPAAVDDAIAATRHVIGHLDDLGLAGARVVVGGESSGGGLAAVVAQRVGGVAGQLLVTPWLDLDGDPEKGSRWLFGDRFLLTNRQLDWYRAHYLTDDAQAADPLASPGRAENVADLPPAVLVIAGFDPLRDEARAYAARLADAAVPVEVLEEPGLPHTALNGTGVSPRVREVVDEVGAALRRLLDGTTPASPLTAPGTGDADDADDAGTTSARRRRPGRRGRRSR